MKHIHVKFLITFKFYWHQRIDINDLSDPEDFSVILCGVNNSFRAKNVLFVTVNFWNRIMQGTPALRVWLVHFCLKSIASSLLCIANSYVGGSAKKIFS